VLFTEVAMKRILAAAAAAALVALVSGPRCCGQEPKAVFRGPGGEILALAFSPDGKTLAAGADDLVGLWDVATGKQRTTLRLGRRSRVVSVAFSPDSKTLATGGGDEDAEGEVKLWDAATGKERATLPGGRAPVYSVAFSPDGKTLASGRFADGSVRLWDMAAGKERATLAGHSGPVLSVAFSPSGKTLASGAGVYSAAKEKYTATEVKLWYAAKEKERATLKGAGQMCTAVAFSPDGKALASTWMILWDPRAMDSTGGVTLWDAATGKERLKVVGPVVVLHHGLAFGPQGTLATGDTTGPIRL
jgi:WD40 repeat protein